MLNRDRRQPFLELHGLLLFAEDFLLSLHRSRALGKRELGEFRPAIAWPFYARASSALFLFS
jgi:hypothetical protein